MMSETWQRGLFWLGGILLCGFVLWLLSAILLPFAVGCTTSTATWTSPRPSSR